MATYGYAFRYDTTLFTRRGHNKLLNSLNRQMGRRHQREILPKHFSNAPETYPGSGGYGYKQRSRRWEQRKLREVGHTLRLVYHGHLRDAVLQQSQVTATKDRWRVLARIPSPVNERGKGKGFRPEVRRQITSEVEAISNQERRETVRLMERLYSLAATKTVSYQEHRRQRIR